MVDDDSAERVDDSDGDGFKEGVYYFGGEDDGAMTAGWIQLDITYDEATETITNILLLHLMMTRIRAAGSTSNPTVRKYMRKRRPHKDKTINGESTHLTSMAQWLQMVSG